ncbi:MAG: tetratricopeptide repeat protein, partial [Flavobacteriaceae bacterium]|nr:tetratricopeptide repeat protein [Flavobacteriaceae bacterium]
NLIEEERLRIEKHLSLQPEDRRALSLGGVWMYTFSNKARGLELMEKALELYPDESGTLFNGACLYSRAGQTERALDLLEKAINKGFGYKEWIDNDPDYDNLRNLPRFKELMHQLEQR